MKYSFYVDSKPERIPRDTTEIHLTRPVKEILLKKVFKRCENLSIISLSDSCFKRLSVTVKQFLARKKIELRIQKSKGRPISIDLEKMLRIIELKKDYRSYNEISQILEIPRSTAHYLIKYADRTKIKQGNETIHLQ